MNPILKKILICPECNEPDGLQFFDNEAKCKNCTATYKIISDKVVMSEIDNEEVIDLEPRNDLESGKPRSSWRRGNVSFIKEEIRNISSDSIVLDIGCGRGFYRPLVSSNYVGTDITLRKEADFVCDLTHQQALKPFSIDVIMMIDILEHVFDFEELLKNTAIGLTSGGFILITVPYAISLHWLPHDYFRYSHFAFFKLAEKLGLKVDGVEAVFNDSFTNAINSLDRLQKSIPSGDKEFRNYIAGKINQLAKLLLRVLGKVLKNNTSLKGVVTDLNLLADKKFMRNSTLIGYRLKIVKS